MGENMSINKIPLPDRKILSGKKEVKNLFGAAVCFAVSFLFCGFSVRDSLSPFGVTFAACLPFEYIYAGIPGCALGYSASLGTSGGLRYWAALFICGALRVVLRRRFGEKKAYSSGYIVSAVGVALSGVLECAFKGFSLEKIILLCGETAVSLCVGVFFRKSLSLISVKIKINALSVSDKVFLVGSICLFLLCASGFTVMGISGIRVVAFMAVMFFACFRGGAYGSMTGACVGACLSVAPGFTCLLPSLTMGGFISGLFSGCGQIICAAVFSVTATVTALIQGKGENIFIIFAESLLAFGAFSLLPSSVTDKIREVLKKSGFVKDEKVSTLVAGDLNRASENVYRICDIINSVSEKIYEDCGKSEEDPAFRLRADEMQKILTDQFRGIGDFLRELAGRVNESRIYDPSGSVSIKSILREGGIETDALQCFFDKRGSLTVEIILEDRPLDLDWKKAKAIMELVTKRRFERPEVEVSQLRTTLTFRQSLPYRLQIGFSKKSADENYPCGDSVSAAARVDGRGFVLISDGMGTGTTAAADSTLTATIMKKLICSGFSFDSALKIVNSALIARSNQESIASIDGIEVNLFTGETVFYKAGASLSIIRKRDRAVTLERSSMPLGILRNISFSKTRFTGEAGDIILLLSDGVTQTDCGWINDELLSWSTNNMEELSMHILKLAALRADKQTADDMTVVAVKIERNKSKQ